MFKVVASYEISARQFELEVAKLVLLECFKSNPVVEENLARCVKDCGSEQLSEVLISISSEPEFCLMAEALQRVLGDDWLNFVFKTLIEHLSEPDLISHDAIEELFGFLPFDRQVIALNIGLSDVRIAAKPEVILSFLGQLNGTIDDDQSIILVPWSVSYLEKNPSYTSLLNFVLVPVLSKGAMTSVASKYLELLAKEDRLYVFHGKVLSTFDEVIGMAERESVDSFTRPLLVKALVEDYHKSIKKVLFSLLSIKGKNGFLADYFTQKCGPISVKNNTSLLNGMSDGVDPVLVSSLHSVK
ncbi:hypothetical protein HOH87_06000 [bacterium]|jgi:hypothetical protein|nr:hypothetical protein [bacterium]